jgi:hypothetical protein
MLPYVVEHFENVKFENARQFQDWVEKQKTNIRTFRCEGVMIEFPNGDEYAFPLFLLSDKTRQALKPSYEQWQADLASQRESDMEYELQRQHDLYLQSQATSFQHQQELLQVARLQLLLSAVQTGAIDLWEVYLYPPPGRFGYPLSVVVMARNSEEARVLAMQRNPGYQVGPIRKSLGY